MRHAWKKVDEDMRTSLYQERPLIHRCGRCGLYRLTSNLEHYWQSLYTRDPFVAGYVKKVPECRP